MKSSETYDAFYYEYGCGKPYKRTAEWLSFFDSIAERIVSDIGPSSVLDAGCAMGFLVEKLRARGSEAYGIDVSTFAIENVHASTRAFCSVASILDPFPQTYDLIVTIEVLEHLHKADAEKAVGNLCAHTDDILFSSSPSDFNETTHFNVQPPEYWAEHFARHSFYRDVDFDASFLTPWAVRFRRKSEPTHRIVRDYERIMARVAEERNTIRGVNLELKNQLAQNEQVIKSQERELENITQGITYQFARRLRRMIPEGSRRERFLRKILQKTL